MRTRDLKPDFWTDERIVDLSDSAKLLYQGLWGLADREGRLDDTPTTIGFKVRPWDPRGVPALVDELIASKLVVRYAVEGRRYLAIPTFPKHQRFHPAEKPRGLPGPNDPGAAEVNLGAPMGVPKRGEQVVSNAVSSVSSVPAGSSEFRDAPRKKRDERAAEKPAAAVKVTDPRHAPLVAKLCETFEAKRGEKYPFDGRAGTIIKRLLNLRPVHSDALWPVTLHAAWDRALDATFPDCGSLDAFEKQLPRHLGTGPPTSGAGRAQSFEGTGPLTATEGTL